MTGADLDAFERWLSAKIRGLEIDLTDKVLEEKRYNAGVGHKAGFREALEELQRRRAHAGALPEDDQPERIKDR